MLPLTFRDGLALFREQVPVGPRPYRTFRWGRHVQIWLTEGRDFRSPNTLADALSALWSSYPGIRDRLSTEQGEIREHINVFIGDENVRYTGGLMSRVTDGTKITILPAVSRGRL